LIAAEKRGITVKNVSGYSTESVMQSTFSLVFQLVHQTRYYSDYIREKKWSNCPTFTNISRPFFELKAKRWGIIGMGNIGQRVAEVATSFGCEVCYFSTSGKNSGQAYPQVSLDELMSSCEVISIHAPLNAQTENLITAPQLSQMKQRAVIINVGRGGLLMNKI